jgi:hypothetical protein
MSQSVSHVWGVLVSQAVLNTSSKHAPPKGDVFDEYRGKNIAERENDYQKRRLNRQLSPDRVDAFSAKDQKGRRTYKEAMEEVILDREVRLHFALCFVVFLMCFCVCV